MFGTRSSCAEVYTTDLTEADFSLELKSVLSCLFTGVQDTELCIVISRMDNIVAKCIEMKLVILATSS